MKKITALLLLTALLLTACGKGQPENTTDTIAEKTEYAAENSTFDSRTLSTDRLPETIQEAEQTDTAVLGDETTEAPVTKAPDVTEGQTTQMPVTGSITAAPPTTSPAATAAKPITQAPVDPPKPVTTQAPPAKPVTTKPAETTKPVTTKPLPADPVTPVAAPLQSYYPIENAGHVQLISSTAGGMSGEGSENLFDSDPSTKLCTNTTDYTITWKLEAKVHICGYSIHTGADTAQYDRRPTAWTLEASTDGSSWKMVSNVSSGNLPKENHAETYFAVTPGTYSYFRFTLKAPSSMTQMSEITLYTDTTPQTPALKEQAKRPNYTQSKNAAAGIELIRQTIADYYDRSTHTLHSDLGKSDAAFVWGTASFLEALAEAYRLCPDDPLIYSVYVDVLNNCVGTYRVRSQIKTPTGSYHVTYYNASKGGAGDYYYDDNAWICLQFLNAYDLLGDERYLELTEELLDFFWTGWDEKLCGGIYWDKEFKGKNTCENGPIAIAFLRAYELTHNNAYLTKGKQLYDWTRSRLLEGNLYSDNIGLDGKINNWKAAYNQGTMLCVGALLYRITGESHYLSETTAVYNATVKHMFSGSGSDVKMAGNPIYKSWCIGWLTRGFVLYTAVDPVHDTDAMTKLQTVLLKERATKNYLGRWGYYDPYFCSGDWGNESKTDVLQPSGVATVFMLTGLYELT